MRLNALISSVSMIVYLWQSSAKVTAVIREFYEDVK